MVWLIDDLAEAALGPWGIAVAAGVGLATVARRQFVPAASVTPVVAGATAGAAGATPADADASPSTADPAGAPAAARSMPSLHEATDAVSAKIGVASAKVGAASAAAGAAVGRLGGSLAERPANAASAVKDRVQTAVTEVSEYWQDLYAEAHAEWEQARTQHSTTIILPPSVAPAAPTLTDAPVIVDVTGTPISSTGRVRGPNGQYLKEAE